MLICQKEKFSLPTNQHFINCATMGPLSKKVVEIGQQAIFNKAQPAQITQDTFFEYSESLKNTIGKMINASAHRIALVPSVSYGMAVVAKNLAGKKNLKPGHHILVVQDEFPSDVYAWDEICANKGLRIRTINAPENLEDRGKVWNERLIRAINPETAIVVVCPVHWSDGTLFDLINIGHHCRLNDALLVIDGTQSLGAMPFDVQQVKPDALVCAGYKWLLGPYSCGFAYYGSYFDDGVPIEQNWINRQNSNDFKNLINYQSNYRPGAYRYNMGEQSNFILNPMLQASLEQLMDWGIDNIQNYCKNLTAEPINALRQAGYWVEKESHRANHLFGVRVPKGKDLTEIQKRLEENNVLVSFRGAAIRISPNIYNNEADMAALVKSMVF